MPQGPTIHRIPATIFSPQRLRQALKLPHFDHYALSAMLPKQLVDQLADPGVVKTCFLAVLAGNPSNVRHLLLTTQIDETQVVVVAPLASALVQKWLLQALEPESNAGNFRFLLTADDGEVVSAFGLPYSIDDQGTPDLRRTLVNALEGAKLLSPEQQRNDYRRAISLAEMPGNAVSLIEDTPTRERHVVVVRPRDWPDGDSLDDAEHLTDVMH